LPNKWRYFVVVITSNRWQSGYCFNKRRKNMKKLLLILTAFVLQGCTCAGPFVTNISQNKDGTLSVEKCMVEHNAFSGAIATTNCTQSKV